MPAKRKTPAKSSAKKSTAKTPAKSTGAKRKPSTAKKSTRALPAPAEQMPVPGEEAPPPAPEGQPPPDTAAVEPAAMEAAATGAPLPPPPVPKRRNPLLVPFIIVLILLLFALAALAYAFFFASTTTTVSTSPSPAAKKAANGTFGGATGGSCKDVSHPEDQAGSQTNATRHDGSDDKPDLVTSSPPTSGIHGKGFASNGSNYTNPQPLGYLVHSMDHGSVVIWHRNLSQEELKALVEVANSNLRRDYAALVMVPYNDMESKIALTAWGSLMQCDSVNADAINDFVTEFMATGPEAAAACLDMPENHPRCS
jgi:hypothetical protein